MEINTEQFALLSQFNGNWEKNQNKLCLNLSREEIQDLEVHPLVGELTNLINKKGGSLPFFSGKQITWCTMAPDSYHLRRLVEQLQSWVLPSYGWQESNDGYKKPDPSGSPFQQAINGISSEGYFRWHSLRDHYSVIERKLATRYQLEEKRPERTSKGRCSLYELRMQFHMALTLGDRVAAENAIDSIDACELDKALNTQMMRIRLWHHFREFENIKNCRNLPNLLTQTSLPSVIKGCIVEALGEPKPEPNVKEEIEGDWESWFVFFIDQKDVVSARQWLEGKKSINVDVLKQDQVKLYSDRWDSIYLISEFKEQYDPFINEALVIFLGDFVRESEFPRKDFAELYLSLLRLWGKMNAGIGRGREEGHVLLELANALFELNYKIDEAKNIIEEWWKTRPVPSQLTFALDAIELLTIQHPDTEASGNLWIEAADIAKRNTQQLLESEKILWRSAGTRIGLDEETIHQYFPVEHEVVPKDPLINANLRKVAIVCMREQQALVAAETIKTRTGAKVFIVSNKVAGLETDQALSCDVVLFVWISTTHAVFRAFDDFDRKKLCYVQGTGAASIIRTLEKWCMERLN